MSPQLVEALHDADIVEAFPVQTLTIPDALAGRDVSGRAPTGSGKTLAFGIPMIERIQRAQPHRPTGLILAPTRELAKQICDALVPLARVKGVRVHAFYGGAAFAPQVKAMERGVDICVACPGRLLDLIEQRVIDLSYVKMAVIDEADRMADMGFLPDVRALLDMTHQARQTLLFSATLDGDVDVLVQRYQRDPVRYEVEPPQAGAVHHHLWVVPEHERTETAVELIAHVGPTVVFARTRHGAERLAERLSRSSITAISLHGGISQAKREAALEDFRQGRVHALVATDVAARGIHVDAVACVLQYDLPHDAKDFLHRSGRTGRAGEGGTVVTFVPPREKRTAQIMASMAGIDELPEPPDITLIPALRTTQRPAPGHVGGVAFSVSKH